MVSTTAVVGQESELLLTGMTILSAVGSVLDTLPLLHAAQIRPAAWD
jgi:hypothetical protein